MEDAEFIWACGLFEGEGTAFISGKGTRTLAVSMTDEDAVRRVANAFGGRIYGPYQAAGVRKPFWRWISPAKDIQALAIRMIPWVCSRRAAQLQLLIDSLEERPVGHRGRSWTTNGLCRNGHELAVVGIYEYPDGKKKGCRACRRIALEQFRERRAS